MDDIRDVFFINFYKELKKNKKLILLSVDQGAMMLKKIQKDFPSNFINIGISEQNKSKIFQAFNKIDLGNNEELNSQGCGLGLLISQALSKKLNPTYSKGIEVES
jgi:signal transduction histidine kinase